MSVPPDLPRWPPRRPESHKGDYGRVLVIAGSRGMTGAASLAGRAALRSGAGLVYLAVPECCWQVVASLEPGYLTIPLPETPDGQLHEEALPMLRARCQEMDAIAIGPGLGLGHGVVNLVRECYAEWLHPLVVDADGLNALAAGAIPPGAHAGPRVLTPHPGEFRRLLAGEEPRPEQAVAYAHRHEATMVLKGHRTLVTDGEREARNETGNPGMATGGSGDVLTGIIAALLGQKLAPFDAARLAVFVHGLAGDLAAEAVGQTALTATDLIDYLPQAWCQIERSRSAGEVPAGDGST